MIILVEVLNNNNEFKTIKLDTKNKNIIDLKIELSNLENISINNQAWYLNNYELDDNTNIFFKDTIYNVYFSDNKVSLAININGELKRTPQLSTDTSILEIKNILSINDNIYFRNIKLLDHKNIKYYNLNNNSILVLNSKSNSSIL